MNLVGKRVKHTYSRQKGVIVYQDGDSIIVVYDEDKDRKKFPYPIVSIGSYIEFAEPKASENSVIVEQSSNTISSDDPVLLFTKNVNWSLLNYGFTVPQKM